MVLSKAMSVNMKESRLAGYITCENAAGGGSFIAFSHSCWNGMLKHIILMADCNRFGYRFFFFDTGA